MKVKQRFFSMLGRMSLFKKLMLSSVGVLICACLCVSCFLIVSMSRLLHENSRQQSEQEMSSIINGFTGALVKQYETLEELVSYQPMVTYLDADFKSHYEKYLHFNETTGPWLQWLRRFAGPLSMKIYMDGNYQSIASITGGKLSRLRSLSWYGADGARKQGTCTAFANTIIDGEYADALIYWRNVWDRQRSEIRRVVTVSQSSENLRKDILTDAGSLYYLIDPQDIVISSNDPQTQGWSIGAVVESKGMRMDDLLEKSMISIGETSYYIRLAELNLVQAGLGSGWRVLYFQDFTEVERDIATQIFRSALVCTLFVLAALAMAFSVSYNITNRLNLLMTKIDFLGHGDFETHIVVPGNDEISRIDRSFDHMTGQLYRLIRDNEEANASMLRYERRQRELMEAWKNAEYQVLRAQINPHYLFNTLEAFRMNLLINGERETSNLIRIFADTMREYMDIQRMYASLGDELRFIFYYMQIQKFRMGDRLEYADDVDEALLDVMIPRLMLQPIVENAVNHGVDQKVEGGRIELSAHLEGEWLEISVSDNGTGMNAEQLELLRSRLNSDRSQGRQLGLWNIHRRLKLLYGDEGGIAIESVEGSGSIITMRLRVTQPDGEGRTENV